jgi:hypothetical protein
MASREEKTEGRYMTVLASATFYAAMADKMERDPIQVTGANGRATVPNGRGFARWQRCHPGERLVSVHDEQGREWMLTPKQAAVFDYVRTIEGNPTQRDIARAMAVAPSTISRALWKLQAIGLIVFLVGRGRYAGMVIIRRVKGDGLDRFRQMAKDKLREWRLASERRVSRLGVNVASLIRGRGDDSLTTYYRDTYTDATLTARPWTAQEIEEALA